MKLLFQSLRLTLVFTFLTGLLYPLFVTGVAQLAFHDKANGTPSLLAQKFTSPKYFWPRPSAGDFGTVPSGASNFGPTSAALRKAVQERRDKLGANAPADLLYASGSGLDPHISPEAARFQIARVAAARGVGAEKIAALVEKFVEPPQLGFLGEPRVNVLLLNLALDRLN